MSFYNECHSIISKLNAWVSPQTGNGSKFAFPYNKPSLDLCKISLFQINILCRLYIITSKVPDTSKKMLKFKLKILIRISKNQESNIWDLYSAMILQAHTYHKTIRYNILYHWTLRKAWHFYIK